jgi:hypothetical protein
MKMDRRRLLVIGVLVLAVGWIVHLTYVGPWLTDMGEADKKTASLKKQVREARNRLGRKDAIKAEEKMLTEALDRDREGDVVSSFQGTVRDLCSIDGLTGFNISLGNSQKMGAFTEQAVTTGFNVTWRAFVTLLERLQSEKELLKVQRLSCTSKFEREDHMAVDMTVSTIQRAPTAVKR